MAAKVFNDSELVEESVVKDFFTTAADGKQYHTQFYNLKSQLESVDDA